MPMPGLLQAGHCVLLTGQFGSGEINNNKNELMFNLQHNHIQEIS